jgi:hypothetical protein
MATRDPDLRRELAELQKSFQETADRMANRLNELRRHVGKQPIVILVPQLAAREKDKNPWPGKHRVAEMLTRMLVDGEGIELPSNKARHEAMIQQACDRARRTAKEDHYPGPTTPLTSGVWSKKLEGYALKNCLAVLRDAGYKPAPADKSLSSFVKLIKAGKPGSTDDVAHRVGFNMGEGIHRITFYSGREMMYKGRRYNLQWTQNGKPSIPPNGSASARASADKPGEKAQRIGLKTLLKQTIGADRDAWWAVKKLAGEAEQKARADAALPAVLEKIRRPTVTAETRVADAELDSFFADFDTSTGIPRRDDFDYGGEGGMSEMDDDR